MTILTFSSTIKRTFDDLGPLILLFSEADIPTKIQLQNINVFKGKCFALLPLTWSHSLNFIISTSFNVGQHVEPSQHKHFFSFQLTDAAVNDKRRTNLISVRRRKKPSLSCLGSCCSGPKHLLATPVTKSLCPIALVGLKRAPQEAAPRCIPLGLCPTHKAQIRQRDAERTPRAEPTSLLPPTVKTF